MAVWQENITPGRFEVPVMLTAGYGSIVNASSEAGLRGAAAVAAYTVSKHALIGLTRSSAVMFGRRGIRVNAVAPGGTRTNINGVVLPSDNGWNAV